MATEKQIAANRLNALKSTGPRRKKAARAAQEAAERDNNLLSNSVVLETESQERFHTLLATFMNEYQPTGPTQTALVHIMTAAHWRLIRAWNMEVAGFDYEFSKQSDPGADPELTALKIPVRVHLVFRNMSETRALDVMNRYEARLDRQFGNAFERLLRLKALQSGSEAHSLLRNDEITFASQNPIARPQNPVSPTNEAT